MTNNFSTPLRYRDNEYLSTLCAFVLEDLAADELAIERVANHARFLYPALSWHERHELARNVITYLISHGFVVFSNSYSEKVFTGILRWEPVPYEIEGLWTHYLLYRSSYQQMADSLFLGVLEINPDFPPEKYVFNSTEYRPYENFSYSQALAFEREQLSQIEYTFVIPKIVPPSLRHPSNAPLTFFPERSESYSIAPGVAIINRYDGIVHNSDAPAFIIEGYVTEWWVDGLLHREDGPAVEYTDGHKEWWLNGKKQKTTTPLLPAPKRPLKNWTEVDSFITNVEDSYKHDVTTFSWSDEKFPYVRYTDGGEEWWLHGKLHRDNGPAIDRPGDQAAWYYHGKLHRANGPAVEYCDGGKEWWVNGVLHRVDGPAVEHPDGRVEYWLHGVKQRI